LERAANVPGEAEAGEIPHRTERKG